MNKKDLIKKIIEKKEFSKLPEGDVFLAFEKYDNKKYIDEEKIKLTRDLLRKVYTAFLSTKLLNLRDKNIDWFLKKHLSTKERFSHYSKLYKKVFHGFTKNLAVIDLGCGINGFSYKFFGGTGFNVKYIGVEAVGQLVNLQKKSFEGVKGVSFFHESLFNLSKIKKILDSAEEKKVVFLFKVLDSLEVLKRDYSKELLLEIVPLVDRVVVSFATRSLVKQKKFFVNRNWIVKFIQKQFFFEDDFEMGGERYFVFSKKSL
ncbi:hypothetical protein J4411_02745 [Candidatus Pacearchaeota archaeon]|nr:hypothetical protein [Candidatus Pacearchaeota archaeon]